jgi:indoleamine 2,3-dioxygenase
VVAGRGELRAWLHGLPPFPTQALLAGGGGSDELWRAYLLLSLLAHVSVYVADSHCHCLMVNQQFAILWSQSDNNHQEPLAQGYLWCDGPGVTPLLPASLAGPWCAVSTALDMPPVLTYSSCCLSNWRRLDAGQPMQLGNIVCLHNFLGGIGEQQAAAAAAGSGAQAPLCRNAAVAIGTDAARASGRASVPPPAMHSCMAIDCDDLGACR